MGEITLNYCSFYFSFYGHRKRDEKNVGGRKNIKGGEGRRKKKIK